MSAAADDDPEHWVVIGGRRWRATDPLVPAARRDELQHILMAWRREVKRSKGTSGEAAARAGVQAAKVALGERGAKWWTQTREQRAARWSAEVAWPGERPQDASRAGTGPDRPVHPHVPRPTAR